MPGWGGWAAAAPCCASPPATLSHPHHPSTSPQVKWAAEGLGADRQSVENGAIVCATAGARWPLLVDPQLQGARWVAGRESGLRVVQQTDDRFLETASERAGGVWCAVGSHAKGGSQHESLTSCTLLSSSSA